MKDTKEVLNLMIFVAAILLMVSVGFAFAENAVKACPQADGTTVYTNKAVEGCHTQTLPELSVVPSPRRSLVVPPVSQDIPSLHFQKDAEDKHDPTVNDPFCELYGEWLQLSKRTLGGFVNNTVQDTQRRMFLTQIFGSGFPPYNCK